MKTKKYLSILAAFGLTAISHHAAVISYTDRNAWEAAVESFTEVTFNSFDTNISYMETPVDVGDFSISMTGTHYTPEYHSIGPTPTTLTDNGTGQVNITTTTAGATTFTFDRSIVAFGADFDGPSTYGVTAIEVGGIQFSLPNDGVYGSTIFFGFVSDTPHTDLFFFNTERNGDSFALDNAVYSYSRETVPDSGSSALLVGISLISLACIRRRIR